MPFHEPNIVFVDNAVHRIFKTLDVLRIQYPGLNTFTGEEALFDFLSTHDADVIFLNLDLQPNDGVMVLKEIRYRKLPNHPFVVLYAERQDDFAVELAFNAGADAFIGFHAKPAVLSLYLRNLLKRRIKHNTQEARAVLIDKDKHLIFKNGTAIQLPRKEFKLFELLYEQHDKFFSKKEIAQMIWHDESIATKRTIDVHVYNIRQFFGKRIIQSQKGKGYRMNKRVIL